MTRDEVIEFAVKTKVASYGPTSMCPSQFNPFVDCLERFAQLIENATLEKAAKKCMNLCSVIEEPHEFERCAEAIREMKK
jgi:hypothetical protein